MFFYKKISALTLIELLLSLSISIMLLLSITTVYFFIQRYQQAEEAIHFVRDNAIEASHFLGQAIKQSTYLGCARFINIKLDNIELSSDELKVKNISVEYSVLKEPMISPSVLEVSKDKKFLVGEVGFITNCKNADLFVIKNVVELADRQKILTEKPLSIRYGKKSYLHLYSSQRYFIGNTKRHTDLGKPIYSLYMSDNFGNKQEIVEGINHLHYERDKNGITVMFDVNSINAYFLSKKWISYFRTLNSEENYAKI